MSFLGGMFGGSGGALTSAKQGIANAQRGRDQYRKNINEGTDNLKTYLGDKARQEIIDAQSNARGDIQGGVSQAQPYLEQGVAAYDPLISQWGGLADKYGSLAQNFLDLAPNDLAARTMYSNSLGLNGDTGNQAAVNAFHVSPGYQWQVDQANQNILRNGAATGNVLSGNVGVALNDRAQQLANQEYGGWQDRLMNLGNNVYKDYAGAGDAYGGQGQAYTGQGNAIQGKVSGLNNLASLFANEGSGLSNISMTGGAQRSGIYSNLGQGLNANNQLLAQNDYNRAANINNAQQAAAQNAQAQQQAMWSGLLGLGGNLLTAGGNAGGFGNLFNFG